MAAPNLTRAQAQERAEAISVDSYDVVLDLTDGQGNPSDTTFNSITTVRFNSTKPGTTSWIDLVAAEVHSAVLNGTKLDISEYQEENGIVLPDLAETNELVVNATCRYMNTGEGLHRFVDPVDDSVYLYSQFETADAKRMFTCFDQPDLKSTYRLTVTAPNSWTVVSNAPAESTETVGQATKTVFTESKKMSTYLVALVAGPYAQWEDTYTDEHGDIPLRLFCRATLAEHMDAERLFTETKQGFAFYHKHFGIPYPFGKYDQLFVPEFNAGAMENAGAVTYRDEYVFRSRVTHYAYERRNETVLHEMAHMWFGDLVTMKWWDDLWLNESFATWASVFAQVEASQYTEAWTTFANIEKSWAARQDQLPSTHPVAADMVDLEAVEVNFDGITYAKGASILKQLVAYVGIDNFLSGLRIYFKRHAWGNATLADLLAALEESSGRDLSSWGQEWLQTTGLNQISPRFTVDENGKFSSFTVVQSGAQPGAGELRSHRIAVGIYDDDAQGKLVRTNRVELDIKDSETDVPALVGVDAGKLVLANDDDLTYCKLRLDEKSLGTLVDRIADISDPLPRTLGWSAAWDMTRDAEMKTRDFIALICKGIHAETEISVVQRVLLQAIVAIDGYAEPAWATKEGWPTYTARLVELANEAEPGSDHQLAYVNSLLRSVLDDKTLDIIAGWLDDSAPLAGLKVDTDLRWRILSALAAHGKVTSADIDVELAQDNTATGKEKAEMAQALIPTAEVKAEAWRRAIYDDDLPNAISDAIVGGFWHPAQDALLTDYTDKYFEVIADVWQRRSVERAQPVALNLFPRWATNQSTLDKADEWLAQDHPSALRRLVSEGRATTARCITARQFDAS